jgi:hypothetical protein
MNIKPNQRKRCYK